MSKCPMIHIIYKNAKCKGITVRKYVETTESADVQGITKQSDCKMVENSKSTKYRIENIGNCTKPHQNTKESLVVTRSRHSKRTADHSE